MLFVKIPPGDEPPHQVYKSIEAVGYEEKHEIGQVFVSIFFDEFATRLDGGDCHGQRQTIDRKGFEGRAHQDLMCVAISG